PAAVGLGSRPYRITGPLRTDAGLARDALRRGDLDAALGYAVGPVLPRSEAPGIRAIREQLQAGLREAVLQDAGLEQLWAYLGRPEAADDLELWTTALRLLPPDSPRRALAVSTIERISADV
ncbi:MAG TPA: transcriptional regulator, partial [Citricoccus sp.]